MMPYLDLRIKKYLGGQSLAIVDVCIAMLHENGQEATFWALEGGKNMIPQATFQPFESAVARMCNEGQTITFFVGFYVVKCMHLSKKPN